MKDQKILDQIVVVFCIVDDFMKNVLSLHTKNNDKRKLSDAEIITIAIIGQMNYYGNFSLTIKNFISMNIFSQYVEISGVLKRIKRCTDIIELILRILLDSAREADDRYCAIHCTSNIDSTELCVTKKVTIVDSMPIPLCNIVRKNICKSIPKEHIDDYIGYCASKKLYYIGFKLTLICNSFGLPIDYCLMCAKCHDISVFDKFNLNVDDSVLLGDKGYISQDLEEYLQDNKNCTLLTPKRKNMKNKLSSNYYKNVDVDRKTIETTFSKLKTNLVSLLKFVKVETVVLKTKLSLIGLIIGSFIFI